MTARGRLAPWLAPTVPVTASTLAVAVVTVAVVVLAREAPPISLGVLYLFAVLAVAVRFGLAYAVAVSIASMLAFNFFVLPPVHTLRLSDSANWLALAVYLATSGVVSELASRERRRALQAEQREREATLLADIATGLLARGVDGDLDRLLSRAAAIVGGRAGRLALDDDPMEIADGERAFPLVAESGPVGALITTASRAPDPDVLGRFLPALASLLAVAADRERLTREAAEAGQSDLVKTTILRAVSHDLRSPLTAIRVAGEALQHRGLALGAADREDLVATIVAEAHRLDRVVGNLLDLSRLEVGVVHPRPELLTAEGLVGDALSELGSRADRVRVELVEALPPVRVDAEQIRRVLVNLLDNALRYSPADDLVVVRGEPGTWGVVVAVIDRGPGLPADWLHLFQPFVRAGNVPGSGAGLGLAIARGFAEANGCTLTIAEAGPGARFVLELPAASD